MAFDWIWGWFRAAIIVQKESATLSQVLVGVDMMSQTPSNEPFSYTIGQATTDH